MIINQSFLWNKQSFCYKLEDEWIWDINSYWELDLFIINTIKKDIYESNFKLISDIHYVNITIQKYFFCHLNNNDVYSIENISDELIQEFYDRFSHLMRIFWKKIDYKEWELFFLENPLYFEYISSN